MPETPLLVASPLLPENHDLPGAGKPYISAPEDLDRMLHVWQSRYTGGRSPSTVGLALLDWAAHATNSPFQTAALSSTALTQWWRHPSQRTTAFSPIFGSLQHTCPDEFRQRSGFDPAQGVFEIGVYVFLHQPWRSAMFLEGSTANVVLCPS
jgi:Poly-beta-hydroxybutyrate polymerase N terminal